MNYAIVFRLLGYVMLIEGALLLLPAAASWIYGEWFVLGVFLITAAVSAAIGYALRGIKPKSKMFYMREGFAATSLSWIVISIVGAVPFVVAGCIPNPVDALFETVSGFTTTGASILPGWRICPRASCSGAASPTGSAAWAFWCSCSRCCPDRWLPRQPDEGRKPRPSGG